MSNRATRLATTAACAILLGACAPVVTVGERVDDARDIRIGKLQVYSFVPMQSMGSPRLHRDARTFDDALAGRLRGANIETVVADVEDLVRRHGLPVEVRASDLDGYRHSMLLPESELLTVTRTDESAADVSHRLVLTPARLTIDRGTGITYGVLQWRVETVGETSPVAVGLLRYTADLRGFPVKRMARQLVAELHKLGIH